MQAIAQHANPHKSVPTRPALVSSWLIHATSTCIALLCLAANPVTAFTVAIQDAPVSLAFWAHPLYLTIRWPCVSALLGLLILSALRIIMDHRRGHTYGRGLRILCSGLLTLPAACCLWLSDMLPTALTTHVTLLSLNSDSGTRHLAPDRESLAPAHPSTRHIRRTLRRITGTLHRRRLSPRHRYG